MASLVVSSGLVIAAAAGASSFPNHNAFKTVTKHHPGIATGIGNSRHRASINSNINININRIIMGAGAETEKLGIKIVKNPPESKLSDLGVRSWPKWGCPPSKFPWTYSSKETCYLLEGKVKVYPDGSDEAVEVAAGDLVVFPKGMSCTWDVSQAVDKHYKFD